MRVLLRQWPTARSENREISQWAGLKGHRVDRNHERWTAVGQVSKKRPLIILLSKKRLIKEGIGLLQIIHNLKRTY